GGECVASRRLGQDDRRPDVISPPEVIIEIAGGGRGWAPGKGDGVSSFGDDAEVARCRTLGSRESGAAECQSGGEQHDCPVAKCEHCVSVVKVTSDRSF